jgi:hypothetical protein
MCAALLPRLQASAARRPLQAQMMRRRGTQTERALRQQVVAAPADAALQQLRTRMMTVTARYVREWRLLMVHAACFSISRLAEKRGW